MKTYRPKTLIAGYRLDFNKDKFYVGVPKQKLEDNCTVVYRETMQTITKDQKPLKEISFPNKFGSGNYTLCYYEYRPDNEQFSF